MEDVSVVLPGIRTVWKTQQLRLQNTNKLALNEICLMLLMTCSVLLSCQLSNMNFSMLHTLKLKLKRSIILLLSVDTISRGSIFVFTDPQCTLLSKDEGMKELKIPQIPPERALWGLNSSLDVLVQPVCKSYTFLLWHRTKLSENADRLCIVPS